jgi:hypothetical protein
MFAGTFEGATTTVLHESFLLLQGGEGNTISG